MGVTLSMAAPPSPDHDRRGAMRIPDVGQLYFCDGEILAKHDVALQVLQERNFRVHPPGFGRAGDKVAAPPSSACTAACVCRDLDSLDLVLAQDLARLVGIQRVRPAENEVI